MKLKKVMPSMMETTRVAWDPSPDLSYALESLAGGEVRHGRFSRPAATKVLSRAVVATVVNNEFVHLDANEAVALSNYENHLDKSFGHEFRIGSNVTVGTDEQSAEMRVGLQLYLPTKDDRSLIINRPFYNSRVTEEVWVEVLLPRGILYPKITDRRASIERFKSIFLQPSEQAGAAQGHLSLTRPYIHKEFTTISRAKR